MFEESSKSRDIFRTQASIYDGPFLWIYLTAYYFHNKGSIIDVQLGYAKVSFIYKSKPEQVIAIVTTRNVSCLTSIISETIRNLMVTSLKFA